MIESFDNAIGKYKDAAICIASMWREEKYKQICEYDKELSKHAYDLLSSMAWETSEKLYKSTEYEYITSNLETFERLYDSLSDEQSKKTLEGLLNYRLTRDSRWLSQIKSNNVTYIDKSILDKDLLKRISKGVIIDGGAFDGDTVEMLLKDLKPEDSLKIHCYEAEFDNCNVIEDKIAKGVWGPHQIVLHRAALWDSKETIGFAGNGLSGSASGDTDIKVDSECIDDYPYENVGFIKLDIEGAERKALLGARKTIEREKPILAICAYHLQDDLLVLSDFIQSLNCNYKLVLRHYMLSAGDTILYGIPSL